MHQAAMDRGAQWLPGETIVMQNEMQSISLDVIIRAVLGVTEPERLSVFREAIRHAVSEVSPWPLFISPLRHEFFGVGPWARFMRHKRAFDLLLAEEITSARSRPEPGEDILSRLVDCTDEEGQSLSDSAIRDHLVTLLIAGHETTATALAWAFYEVTQHPEIERWLLDEIATLGSEPDPVQLSDLPALQAVSRETLRLHPIVPEFFRTKSIIDTHLLHVHTPCTQFDVISSNINQIKSKISYVSSSLHTTKAHLNFTGKLIGSTWC